MRIVFIFIILACAYAVALTSFPDYLLPQQRGQTEPETGGFFSSLSYAAGISHSLHSDDPDLVWAYPFAATITVYHGASDARLIYFGQGEMIADESNTLHFSPNGIFFDNCFLLSLPFQGGRLGAGYYQRCKHDIDRIERVWLYNGPYADWRIQMNLAGIDYTGAVFLLPLVYEEDQKFSGQPRFLCGLDGKVGLRGCWLRFSPSLVQTAAGNEQYLLFRDASSGTDWRWRLQLRAGYTGRVQAMRLSGYLGYESTEDNGLSLTPRRTQWVSIGFQLEKP